MNRGLDVVKQGTIVGPYRIVRGFRGHGGMAQVFEVEVRKKYRQLEMPRRLALKVAKPEHQAALVAEADFLRLLNHPSVVRIFPLPGFHKPVYAARAEFPFGLGWYYAMELLDGGSLHHTLTRRSTTGALARPNRSQRRLDLYIAAGIVRQIADALTHIHDRHIVNLDVKPANILFRRRPLAYLGGSIPHAILGDFGISRDSRYPRAGVLGVATPEYFSPEHASEMNARYAQIDYRSDLFSLGIVFYEMLTGQMPFANVALIMDPHYVPQRPSELRASLPKIVDDIIMCALEKDPYRRFQTALDMRTAINQIPARFDWPRARRIFATTALVSGLVVGGMWLHAQNRDVESPISTLESSSTPLPAPASTATLLPVSTKTVSPVESGGTLSTSTPRPTLTPSPTRIPYTSTPSPTVQP